MTESGLNVSLEEGEVDRTLEEGELIADDDDLLGIVAAAQSTVSAAQKEVLAESSSIPSTASRKKRSHHHSPHDHAQPELISKSNAASSTAKRSCASPRPISPLRRSAASLAALPKGICQEFVKTGACTVQSCRLAHVDACVLEQDSSSAAFSGHEAIKPKQRGALGQTDEPAFSQLTALPSSASVAWPSRRSSNRSTEVSSSQSRMPQGFCHPFFATGICPYELCKFAHSRTLLSQQERRAFEWRLAMAAKRNGPTFLLPRDREDVALSIPIQTSDKSCCSHRSTNECDQSSPSKKDDHPKACEGCSKMEELKAENALLQENFEVLQDYCSDLMNDLKQMEDLKVELARLKAIGSFMERYGKLAETAAADSKQKQEEQTLKLQRQCNMLEAALADSLKTASKNAIIAKRLSPSVGLFKAENLLLKSQLTELNIKLAAAEVAAELANQRDFFLLTDCRNAQTLPLRTSSPIQGSSSAGSNVLFASSGNLRDSRLPPCDIVNSTRQDDYSAADRTDNQNNNRFVSSGINSCCDAIMTSTCSTVADGSRLRSRSIQVKVESGSEDLGLGASTLPAALTGAIANDACGQHAYDHRTRQHVKAETNVFAINGSAASQHCAIATPLQLPSNGSAESASSEQAWQHIEHLTPEIIVSQWPLLPYGWVALRAKGGYPRYHNENLNVATFGRPWSVATFGAHVYDEVPLVAVPCYYWRALQHWASSSAAAATNEDTKAALFGLPQTRLNVSESSAAVSSRTGFQSMAGCNQAHIAAARSCSCYDVPPKQKPGYRSTDSIKWWELRDYVQTAKMPVLGGSVETSNATGRGFELSLIENALYSSRNGLPAGWSVSLHRSGIPVYSHAVSGVYTLCKPVVLPKAAVATTNAFPAQSVPCYFWQHLRASPDPMLIRDILPNLSVEGLQTYLAKRVQLKPAPVSSKDMKNLVNKKKLNARNEQFYHQPFSACGVWPTASTAGVNQRSSTKSEERQDMKQIEVSSSNSSNNMNKDNADLSAKAVLPCCSNFPLKTDLLTDANSTASLVRLLKQQPELISTTLQKTEKCVENDSLANSPEAFIEIDAVAEDEQYPEEL